MIAGRLEQKANWRGQAERLGGAALGEDALEKGQHAVDNALGGGITTEVGEDLRRGNLGRKTLSTGGEAVEGDGAQVTMKAAVGAVEEALHGWGVFARGRVERMTREWG